VSDKSVRKEIMADLYFKNGALLKQHEVNDFDEKLKELMDKYTDTVGFDKVLELCESNLREHALHPLAGKDDVDFTNNISESNHNQVS
jgi:hypothetical protein